ncbi:MAG: 5'/3'-nucleotidase SurE [Acidimicrobiia bacterium]
MTVAVGRVLITNDDGVDSVGLMALADAASVLWSVVIVAPSSDRSGSAAAIGPLGRGPVTRIELPDRSDVEMYAVDAPPSVAVLAAHAGAFGEPPMAVLSGVNFGANVGRGVMHSGTVGAALTAASLGMTAVAISVEPPEDRSLPPDWALAASLAVSQLRAMLEHGSILAANVNVPCQPISQTLTAATLAPSGRVTAAVEGGTLSFELVVSSDAAADAGTDAALLAAGHPTVTMLDPLGGSDAPIASTRMDAIPSSHESDNVDVTGRTEPRREVQVDDAPDPKLVASSPQRGPFDGLAPGNSVDDESSPEAVEPNEPA